LKFEFRSVHVLVRALYDTSTYLFYLKKKGEGQNSLFRKLIFQKNRHWKILGQKSPICHMTNFVGQNSLRQKIYSKKVPSFFLQHNRIIFGNLVPKQKFNSK
jgi:hypothetical protein